MAWIKFRMIIAVFTGLWIFLSSCAGTAENNSVTDTVNVCIKRFEKDLFTVDFDTLDRHILHLQSVYSRFFDLYNNQIINIGGTENKTYPVYLKAFLTDYTMNLNYQKIMSVYPDVSDVERLLTDGFRRYAAAFPGKIIPSVYTVMSGFNQSIIVTEDVLAVSLDKYLGEDCDFYARLGWPRYMTRNMNRQNIAPDCIRGWALTEFPLNDSSAALLDHMLYFGKIFWFTRQMLPSVHDSLIFGYSGSQLKFCSRNEAKMWIYLIEHKLLYVKDYLTIRKFTGEGPFTKDFTVESPGGAANWLGYKIIEQYMMKNKNVKLSGLMNNTAYQEILRLSVYNP